MVGGHFRRGQRRGRWNLGCLGHGGRGERLAAPGVDAPMTELHAGLAIVVHRLGGLPVDVTPHVLRHVYASLVADFSLADATIAALLGGRGHTISRRHINNADAALLAAADAVATVKTIAA